MMPLIKLLEWDLSHSTCAIKWCSWDRWCILCSWFNNESFLVLAMTNLKHVAEFDDQQVVVKDHSHDLGRVLAKGVQEGGLYKLLSKMIKHRDLVHDTDNLCRLWHKLDLVTYIMEHYLFWMTWCMDCWNSRWRRHDCARAMHSGSMPKLLVQVVSIEWEWFFNTWCVWYD